MFQGVRQGSILYILRKGEKPTLGTAQVVSVSNPYTPSGAQSFLGQGTVVDFKVSTDGDTMELKEIPALLSITTCKDGTIISDNPEDMMAEVKNLHRTSQQIVESAPHHEALLPVYESFYDILDPNLAKEKDKEKRLHLLEEEMKGMKGMLSDIHRHFLTSMKQSNQPSNKE